MRKVSAIVLAVLVAIALASCSGDDGSGTPDGPGWTRLSPEGLQDLMSSEDVYLVNVHVPFEGEITGTDVHIPYTDLVGRLGELPAEGAQTLVLYCRSGNMSTAAAQDLVAAGRTGFFELDGGFIAWNEAGLPFEP